MPRCKRNLVVSDIITARDDLVRRRVKMSEPALFPTGKVMLLTLRFMTLTETSGLRSK